MTPRTKDGLATITFFQHEYEMWKQREDKKKIIIVAAITFIASNLAWTIATKKH